MSDFNKMQLLAQQVAVLQQDLQKLQGEFHGAMNQVANAIQGITKVHHMFTAYVDENLKELREAAGLDTPTDTQGEQDAD